MKIQDEKINELVKKLQNYRNNLQKPIETFEDFNVEELQTIFQDIRKY